MKKNARIPFLISLVVLSSPIFLRAQSVLVDVGSASGNAGATVQVPVYLESAGGAQPAGLQVDVAFNTAALTFTQSLTGAAATAAAKSAASSTLSPGNLRLIVAGINQNIIANGVVALLEFQIAPGAPISTSPLTASGARVTNAQAQTIPSQAGNGLVIIGGGISNPSELFFPQIADGGGFITTAILVNPGNSAVTGLLELFKQDGTALAFNLSGNLDNAFAVSLPVKGLLILESSNINAAVQSGWARMRSSAAIGGSIIYAYAGASGTVISEAGINPSLPAGSFSLSVDTRRGFLAGLAVANQNLGSISLVLTLYSSNGTQLSQQPRSLPGLNQFALLVDQIFPGGQFQQLHRRHHGNSHRRPDGGDYASLQCRPVGLFQHPGYLTAGFGCQVSGISNHVHLAGEIAGHLAPDTAALTDRPHLR